MPEAVYFTAPDGVVYRVFDAVVRRGALVVANPPAPWATQRVFRPETGYRRLYRFAKGESREPTPAELERQLQRAEYLPATTYDPSERKAR